MTGWKKLISITRKRAITSCLRYPHLFQMPRYSENVRDPFIYNIRRKSIKDTSEFPFPLNINMIVLPINNEMNLLGLCAPE